jgi:arsenate reductase (glutaredoxin)
MLKIYGIPTCNSCKKAIKWLEEQKIPFEWINTREKPPSKTKVQKWIDDIGNKVLRNTSGGSYRNLPKDNLDWSDDKWADEFSKDAMLLKRPLFEVDDQAITTGFRNPNVIQNYLDGK